MKSLMVLVIHSLKAEEIEILARIISVADVIEAMSSDRPHRKAPELIRLLKKSIYIKE